MLACGLTYHPGFLVNSSELSGLVHLPPGKALAERNAPIELLETLAIEDSSLLSGTPIGVSSHAGVDQRVCIPDGIRSRSTHLIARHGMGKSTLLDLSDLLRHKSEESKRLRKVIVESLDNPFRPGLLEAGLHGLRQGSLRSSQAQAE